ncbi:hypothetical protein [uncultured Thiodictyon sp.]|uniref:hypothetical protein n=1 Tax=uncultured Thiodictyon sp. TaxID=1846217 RepID=UPI0025D6D587|nr:hypothetical protein [uncultured Thiodictyon sp.]
MNHDFHYQPFYCEENTWWLCIEPLLGAGERHVVFLLSRVGRCPLLHQREAPPGELIAWDYHVVVVDGEGRVWDQDTRLPLPTPGLDWLDRTFALADQLPAIYAPLLRVIPAADYRREFASDRSHMRDLRGRFQRPPPPWPPIGEGMNLHAYLDPEAPYPGRLLDLPQARRWLRVNRAGV